ncbi:restriction endonuclease subunit S [Bacillus sp. S56]|uniref:restriction endonuclease subunit S n=1 Tax=Bacillus sp. S56 TaxID=1226987 RepID=UPI00190AA96D|nr:restriction endonuclease subunit S [Bacillus sp. S56]MBK0075565.1 restriction endonuclease subunit S [Bacillus sp. S56]
MKMKQAQENKEFKQTRIGKIPFEWDIKKIEDIALKVTDGTHDTPKPTETGVPYITAIHVKDGYINFDKCYFVSEEVHENIYKRCNPEKNDLLIVNIGAGTATPARVKVDYEFSMKNVALIKPDFRKVDSRYLEAYQLFVKEHLFKRLTSGGAQPFLSLKEIKKLDIVLPNLEEQQKISSILSAWGKAIELKEKLIEQKKEQKKGLTQHLLTGKIRWNDKEKFSEEEIQQRVEMLNRGEVPEGYVNNGFGIYPAEWNITRFDELFDFNGGYSVSREHLSDKGICYLHYGDIHKFDRSFIDIQKEYETTPKLDKDIQTIRDQYFLYDGDIVFADASEDYDGIGKAITVINERNIPFIAGLHTIVAKDKGKEIVRDYKKFFTLDFSIRKQMMLYATGISVFGISRSNIKKIIVSLPSKLEQQKIGELLSLAELEVKNNERELALLKQQKKGLMQLLLTGKVRVKV